MSGKAVVLEYPCAQGRAILSFFFPAQPLLSQRSDCRLISSGLIQRTARQYVSGSLFKYEFIKSDLTA